jgi:hypothetical protein
MEDKALREVGRMRRPEKSSPVHLRNPEAIHEEILAAVESCLLPALKMKG